MLTEKDMKLYEAIGTRIRKLRTAKHMKQHDLAELLGCKANTISNIERGIVSLNVHDVTKLAECLGCTELALVPEWNKAGGNVLRL